MVAESADPEAQIIFGTVIDDRSNGEVKITVIATGFAPREELLATGTYEPNARQYFHGRARPRCRSPRGRLRAQRRRPRHPRVPARSPLRAGGGRRPPGLRRPTRHGCPFWPPRLQGRRLPATWRPARRSAAAGECLVRAGGSPPTSGSRRYPSTRQEGGRRGKIDRRKLWAGCSPRQRSARSRRRGSRRSSRRSRTRSAARGSRDPQPRARRAGDGAAPRHRRDRLHRFASVYAPSRTWPTCGRRSSSSSPSRRAPAGRSRGVPARPAPGTAAAPRPREVARPA